MIEFGSWYFLLLIPFVFFMFFFLEKNGGGIKYSSLELVKSSGKKAGIKVYIGKYFIAIAIILLIIAMARPRVLKEPEKTKEKGIDIIISLDVSGSMKSIDFKPNRLEASKKVIADFIDNRKNDRIGLVIFSNDAYTKIPLTLDYQVLKETVFNVSDRDMRKDGTAIGMGISVGLNRIKKSEAKSKVIILVTDGDNNSGTIEPEVAAELAKNLGVKVYTIGVGSDQNIMEQDSFFGGKRKVASPSTLNEPLLKSIASKSGGKYFRAKENKSLEKIFENINTLEKSKIEKKTFKNYRELFTIFIKIALILLLIGIALEEFFFIKIP